jgi:hypothetical protein
MNRYSIMIDAKTIPISILPIYFEKFLIYMINKTIRIYDDIRKNHFLRIIHLSEKIF